MINDLRLPSIAKTSRKSRARVVFPLDEGPDIPIMMVLGLAGGWAAAIAVTVRANRQPCVRWLPQERGNEVEKS